MLQFEYDVNKSLKNETKHGINFEDAQRLWSDPYLIVVPAKNTSYESRYLAIGRIDEKYWSAIVTYRDEKIRIISMRRARTEEVNTYEN